MREGKRLIEIGREEREDILYSSLTLSYQVIPIFLLASAMESERGIQRELEREKELVFLFLLSIKIKFLYFTIKGLGERESERGI